MPTLMPGANPKLPNNRDVHVAGRYVGKPRELLNHERGLFLALVTSVA